MRRAKGEPFNHKRHGHQKRPRASGGGSLLRMIQEALALAAGNPPSGPRLPWENAWALRLMEQSGA